MGGRVGSHIEPAAPTGEARARRHYPPKYQTITDDRRARARITDREVIVKDIAKRKNNDAPEIRKSDDILYLPHPETYHRGSYADFVYGQDDGDAEHRFVDPGLGDETILPLSSLLLLLLSVRGQVAPVHRERETRHGQTETRIPKHGIDKVYCGKKKNV